MAKGEKHPIKECREHWNFGYLSEQALAASCKFAHLGQRKPAERQGDNYSGSNGRVLVGASWSTG